MRTLLKVTIPVVEGNKSIQEGTLPRLMKQFSDEHKPEAAYFTADNGQRTAFFVFDLKEPSHIPAIAEPFFSKLNAGISFQPVMNAQDLAAGLERIGKK